MGCAFAHLPVVFLLLASQLIDPNSIKRSDRTMPSHSRLQFKSKSFHPEVVLRRVLAINTGSPHLYGNIKFKRLIRRATEHEKTRSNIS
jgi:hypothetical protein